MAKIRSQHGGEVARLRHPADGTEVVLTSDGRRLVKSKGGRWSLKSRFSGAPKGDLRNAYIAHAVSNLQKRGFAVVHLDYAIEVARASDAYDTRVEEARIKLGNHVASRREQEAERMATWEAGRPQREQEEREREQFAAKAVEVRQAASHAICCTACGGVLDQSTTVYAKFISGDTVTAHAVALHGDCFDRLVGDGRHYRVVADGRTVPAHVWRCSTEALVGFALAGNRAAAGGAR